MSSEAVDGSGTHRPRPVGTAHARLQGPDGTLVDSAADTTGWHAFGDVLEAGTYALDAMASIAGDAPVDGSTAVTIAMSIR